MIVTIIAIFLKNNNLLIKAVRWDEDERCNLRLFIWCINNLAVRCLLFIFIIILGA